LKEELGGDIYGITHGESQKRDITAENRNLETARG
jgi:hypothetical protein